MAMLRIATLDPLWNPRRLRATAEDGDAAPAREDDPYAPREGPSEAPVEASQRRFSGKFGTFILWLCQNSYWKWLFIVITGKPLYPAW